MPMTEEEYIESENEEYGREEDDYARDDDSEVGGPDQMAVGYEWAVSTLEGDEDDVVDITHFEARSGAFRNAWRLAQELRAEGLRVMVELVRDKGDEVEGLTDRQWAEVDDAGRLSDEFSDGTDVPVRFLREVNQ